MALLACESKMPPQGTADMTPPADVPQPSINAARLEPGSIRHVLSPEQRTRIAAVQKTLADVDSSSLERWFEDFSRDEHPDREIEIYEAIAAAYSAFTANRTLSPPQRQETYALLLARSGASLDEVLATFSAKHLTREQVHEALGGYSLDPQPVIVTPAQ